ncbi:MAG: DMT family transporter [Solirubrobacteraceae bacterium]|nr:MAG: EamA/RhaT family transporter [Solirubrobacterales bacterium]
MSPRAWIAFGGVATLWGIPYLFIKVSDDGGIPPVFLAWSRLTLAAGVLLALSKRAGVLGPLRGRLRWLVIYAALEMAIPFPLIATGEQRIASSLAAILIATVPLIIALLALRFDPTERVNGRRLAGLAVGLAGVVALVGIDVAGRPSELIGAAMVLLAAVGYAAGPMIFNRKLADLDPRAAMGAALALAAIVLTPAAALDPPQARPSAGALMAVVVLGLFCTAAAFVLFAGLVSEIGPGRAAVITYIAPIVAVALGVTVLGESIGAGAVAGLLLILAGSWISTDGRLPPGVAAVSSRVSRRRRRRPGAPASGLRPPLEHSMPGRPDAPGASASASGYERG